MRARISVNKRHIWTKAPVFWIESLMYARRAPGMLQSTLCFLLILATHMLTLGAGLACRPVLTTWGAPAGTPSNATWSVDVREKNSATWIPLFVYAVKIGRQEASEPLAKSVGLDDEGPVDTSLVKFDFDGEVDVRATFREGELKTWTLSPATYRIPARQEGNTLFFSIAQDVSAPRKIVIRVNDNWEEHCLHLLSNPPEQYAPQLTDANVHVIEPGQEIPRSLPPEKTVYYFQPGIHVLPRGAWLDVDLGAVKRVDRFEMHSGPVTPYLVPGGQNYRLEYRETITAAWRVASEDLANASIDSVRARFPAVNARYVRLTLLGNTTTNRTAGFNYPHANHITTFRLYPEGSEQNCADGKAVDGSAAGFVNMTTNENAIPYGSVWSGETFLISRSGTTVYLAGGAVLKGAIGAEGLSNVSIRGRGILDASGLVHQPSSLYREGRTSAIRCEGMTNVLIDGITVLDAPMWSVVLNKSKQATVRQVDVFGSIVNADGIHLSAVTDGLVHGCFLRSTDDLFCMYHYGPAKNVTVRDSVFWSDGGRAVLLGLGATPGNIEQVFFENIDILNVQNVWSLEDYGGAIQLWATGNNTIRTTEFKNVRVEPFRFPSIAALLQIKTTAQPFGPGKIQGVTFDTMIYSGSDECRSYLAGASSDYSVSEITFRNCQWGNSLLKTRPPQLEIRPFVTGVTFEE